tara:strand:+ start:908 stop:1027 length:120 start_codon:yes stop_codon:yes gene_type:complete
MVLHIKKAYKKIVKQRLTLEQQRKELEQQYKQIKNLMGD